MDEKTTKIIKERFDALPESIQEVILSSHYEETLLEIGKQYNLKVEQLGALERETTLVMMGLTPTKSFETELTRELGVDQTKGSQIVKDINEKIFFRIRELLKLMNTPIGEEPSLDEDEVDLKNTGVDWDILNKAGIEIVEDKPNETMPVPDLPAVPSAQLMQAGKLELNSPNPPPLSGEDRGGVLNSPHPDPLLVKEREEIPHPILTQKLSGFSKSEVVETGHSLDNLTKGTGVPTNTAPKSGYTVDPYRMKPE